MSIFSSLLSGGLGLLGNKLAGDRLQSGANAAMAAVAPQEVRSPLGTLDTNKGKLDVRLPGQLQGIFSQANELGSRSLSDLGSMDFKGREAAELERLQTLRRPEIDRARSRLQSQLLNRGRIGLGVGGGLGKGLFQPESAALEEAILRSQLGDIGAARQFSQQEQSFLGNQAKGLFGIGQGIAGGALDAARLGLAGRAPAGIAGLQAGVGAARGNSLGSFFSALGTGFSGGGLSGLFLGGEETTHPGLPPGARPNSLGGFKL